MFFIYSVLIITINYMYGVEQCRFGMEFKIWLRISKT